MFAAADWKYVLIEQRGLPPVSLMLDNIEAAIAQEDALNAIRAEREIQLSQQDNWDGMNDDSFPASDAVARY